MFLKVPNGDCIPVRLIDRFHIDGPDPSGNWLFRCTGQLTGTVELGAFPTRPEAEAALMQVVAGFGYVEVP